MQKTLIITLMVATMAGSAIAQLPMPPSTHTPRVETSTVRFQARDILGATVKNPAGDTLGKVQDLFITGANDVTQAILSVGGVLGMGEKQVAVPYDKLQVSRVDNHIAVMYNATKAKLESMPEFVPTPSVAGEPRVQARDLLGTNITNASNETIGEVKDLIITEKDKVPQAIISVGGFLGIGDKLVAVPYQDLRISRVEQKQHVVYNTTQEQLKAMPTFTYN